MVVWALADDFYNLDTEQCNAGFTSLGHAVGRKRRSTISAIDEAKEAGWITVSSIGGGSKRSTNRYALVWEKVASSAAPEKPFSESKNPSAEAEQPTDNVEETVEAPEAAQTQPPSFQEGEYTEIVEENEKEGCSTLHQCTETSVGVQYPAHEPNLNLEEVKEGGRDQPSAACGFAAPLKREEELAFQQLCQLWQVRDQYWPDIDMAKAREAFAAVSAEYGNEIRGQHGVDVGYYLLARARVWIDAFVAAHPDGDGPKYLKKLEVWLGAPDGKNNVTPWWQKVPTPNARGSRGRKPDLLAVAINGRRHAA
jgi:hypothetical protein